MNDDKKQHMYRIRGDIDTDEKIATLCYAFLKIDPYYMPEVSMMNPKYDGNHDRPEFVFGSDLYADTYTSDTIPDFETFKRSFFENGSTAICIASVDDRDEKRVSLMVIGGCSGYQFLNTYDEEPVEDYDAFIEELYSTYDAISTIA